MVTKAQEIPDRVVGHVKRRGRKEFLQVPALAKPSLGEWARVRHASEIDKGDRHNKIHNSFQVRFAASSKEVQDPGKVE